MRVRGLLRNKDIFICSIYNDVFYHALRYQSIAASVLFVCVFKDLLPCNVHVHLRIDKFCI